MSRLFVCGDLHGDYDIRKLSTKNWLTQKELTKEDVLIQLGDFGLLWDLSKRDKTWLSWLAGKNFTTAVVLGNHENYDLIEKLPTEEKWGGTVQYYQADSGNKIYFFKRGGIYTVNGRKVLTVGGAASIDKAGRLPGVSWWHQEDITAREIEECFNALDDKGYSVDYILAHTCPESIKFGMFPDLYADFVCHTSNFLSTLVEQVDFKEFHFGHFHEDVHYGEYFCHYNNPPMELTA